MKLFLALILFLLLGFGASAQMAFIVDGDTLKIEGVTYRINGIDAPEYGQKCGNWKCGADATIAIAQLIDGKLVQCEPDLRP